MDRASTLSDDLVDASTICTGWHPKLPWITCARAAAHRDEAGPMCKGIEARSGDVYVWHWTPQASGKPGTAHPEVEGMRAVPDDAEPWATRLQQMPPPEVARAAGALITVTPNRTAAFKAAWTLYDAGLLPAELGDIRRRLREAPIQADRDRLAAELAELHTWPGLMTLLDEHWPADVVDGSSDDPGARIVVLMREVDRLRNQLPSDDRASRIAPLPREVDQRHGDHRAGTTT